MIVLPEAAPGLEGLVLNDESVGLVVSWTCPSAGFCAASLPDWPVAPLRLQAQIKRGSSWSDVPATVSDSGEETTFSVRGLDREMVHQFQTRGVNADGGASDDLWSDAVALIPLGVEATGEDVELDWEAPTGYGGLTWQYRYKGSERAMWNDWQAITTSGATNQTVMDLTVGERYQFQVRARSGTTPQVVSFIESATLEPPPAVTVSYGSSTYSAAEGGAAVEVTVLLSLAPLQTLKIPITVSAEEGTEATDYTVAGLARGDTLVVSAGTSDPSFSITAREDDDIDNETVTLGFGTLPSGTNVGTPSQAMVTLSDNDVPPRVVSYGSSAYSAQEGGAAVAVTVLVSAAPSQTLKIPITVSADASDYTVSGLARGDTLVVSAGTSDPSFTIMALEDEDTDDETVTLGFGTLPSWSNASVRMSQAVVTLRDNDDRSGVVSLSKTEPEVGDHLTATLSDLSDGYPT